MQYPNRDRWLLEDEARLKLLHMPPEATDSGIIEAAADYLLSRFSGKIVHLSILDADPPPVDCDWEFKNVCGITTMDPDRARTWIRKCMRLGFAVYASRAKRGFATGPGSVREIRQRAAQDAELRRKRASK